METLQKPGKGEKWGFNVPSRKAKRSDIHMAHAAAKFIDGEDIEAAAAKHGHKIWSLPLCHIVSGFTDYGNTPPRVFVVRKELLEGAPHNTSFPSQTIFNPRITKAVKEFTYHKAERRTVWDDATERREIRNVLTPYTVSNMLTAKEGHIHYLRYKPRNVERYYTITVFYWYPVQLPLIGYILWPKWETVEGMKALIFQQMIDDFNATSYYATKNRKKA